jgi:hypothetical protein
MMTATTPRVTPRPKMLAVRRPVGDRAVEQTLRDIAFVLKMTQRVKHSILTGEPLRGSTAR